MSVLFVISVFYSVLLNVGKGSLAKDGSLASHNREKFSEITKGVTLSMVWALNSDHALTPGHARNLEPKFWCATIKAQYTSFIIDFSMGPGR